MKDPGSYYDHPCNRGKIHFNKKSQNRLLVSGRLRNDLYLMFRHARVICDSRSPARVWIIRQLEGVGRGEVSERF